mmetsp:Transcript_27250/g.76104  ORF Transcript_27250/g.76104 Transcript_27250/m.76104 type:complete len:81 (+) Transcript_27250:53-295(+)
MSINQFVTKDETRQACWDARDTYWQCIDHPTMEDKESKCAELKRYYYEKCPKSWVKHFEQRKQAEVLRKQMDEQMRRASG